MNDAPTTQEEYERILESLPEERQASFKRMYEAFRPWEELHPDLRAYIVDGGPFGGSMLKHPLVFDVMYSPGVRDGMFNDMYEQKKQSLREYEKEGNWSGYVWMFERPYRLDALVRIQHKITDDCKFWELVGNIWTDTENARQNYDEWEELLTSDRDCRNSMMDEQEREFLAKLPTTLTIYRGYRFKDDEYDGIEGFSWTLSEERAEWFARRFAGVYEDVPMVATATIHKADVIAYFDGRGEQEILALPKNINLIGAREV